MSIARHAIKSANYSWMSTKLGGSFARALVAERDRWLLWLPVFLGIGIAIYFELPTEPPVWLGAVAIGIVAIAIVLISGSSVGRPVLLVFLMIAFGFAAASWRQHSVSAPVIAKRIGPVMVSGVVWTLEQKEKRYRITLHDVGIERLQANATPARVRLSLASKFLGEVKIGDQLQVLAILMPPPEPMSASGFDFARYAYFQRLGAVGFTLGPLKRMTQDQSLDSGFGLWLAQFRHDIGKRIRTALPSKHGALANAFMTGDRSSIDAESLRVLRNSGLAHLLAISGLHMGLIAGWLFIFVRVGLALLEPVALRFPIKKWAAGVAVIGALAYLLLTGETIPTQRAFIMVAIVLTAVVFDRTPISMRLVAWAAFLVLLLLPESLLSVSFQMSFAAVISLVAVYEAFASRIAGYRAGGSVFRRGMIYLGTVALTTLVASSATAPFAIYHFNQMALYSIAANVIAVPVMAFWIMPAALVSFILLPLGWEYLPLAVMEQGIALVLWVANNVAHWPHAVFRLATPHIMFLIGLTGGGIWLCLWRGRWRYAGLFGFVLAFVAPFLSQPVLLHIDGAAKLVAVQDETGLRLSNIRRSKNVAAFWYRRAGLATPDPEGRRMMQCDFIGCTTDARGYKIAVVKGGRALAEDCRWADIVVAFVPTRGKCQGPQLVIDRFDIWRGGAIDVKVENGLPVAYTAMRSRGDRPWVRQR